MPECECCEAPGPVRPVTWSEWWWGPECVHTEQLCAPCAEAWSHRHGICEIHFPESGPM
jgi:hypothetical protein